MAGRGGGLNIARVLEDLVSSWKCVNRVYTLVNAWLAPFLGTHDEVGEDGAAGSASVTYTATVKQRTTGLCFA